MQPIAQNFVVVLVQVYTKGKIQTHQKHPMFLPILRYWELRLGGVGLKKPSWEMQKSEALPYVVFNEPHREASKTGSFCTHLVICMVVSKR